MATCSDCNSAEAVHDSPREHKDDAANVGLCGACYLDAFVEVNGPDADITGGPDMPPVANEGDVPA